MTAQTVLPVFRSSRARTAGIAGLVTAVAVAGAVASAGGVAQAGTSTTLQPVSISLNTDPALRGGPALGSSVSFTVNMNGNRAKNPRLVVRCFQDGVLVYGENGPLDGTFKLGGDSSPWQQAGGSASCTSYVADYVFAKGKWTVTTFPGSLAFQASA